jgi:hypothetical protein
MFDAMIESSRNRLPGVTVLYLFERMRINMHDIVLIIFPTHFVDIAGAIISKILYGYSYISEFTVC